MALAILRTGELTERGWRFPIDIGKNRFYRFVIGSGERKSSSGIKIIDDKSFVSPVIGPLPETAFGRSFINVAVDKFSKENSYLQLYSYRTRDLKGVAISDIREVQPSRLQNEDLDLPAITFSNDFNYAMEMQQVSDRNRIESVPFSYRERQMSNALFLDNIVRMIGGALPQVMPMLRNAAPVVGSLLSGLGANGSGSSSSGTAGPNQGQAGGVGSAITALLNSPEISRLIQDLLTRTLQGTSPTPAATAAVAQQQALAESFERYSEAKIAPALLAALPALAPLLQNVLNPETIGRVLDQPQRMIGAVTDSLVNLGRVGIESHEQNLRHLRELHNVNGPPVDALLATLSLSLSTHDRLLSFRRLESVKLKFDDVVTVAVEGNQRVVYSANQAISFPLTFESPGSVSNAQLQLSVKNPSNGNLVFRKTFRLKKVESGPIRPVPSLTLEEVKQKIKPETEYLVSAQLVWKNKKKENVGVVMSQLVYIMDNFIYGGTNGAGDPIPLNDVEKFREFWHKVWAVAFRPERKRFKIDCKYYYILEKERQSIGRMETVTKTDEDEFPVNVQMKSGTILNVKALNMLLPRISSHQPLTQQEIAALDSDEFAHRFHSVARIGLDFNGFKGENAVLWVYPEVKIHRFVLKSPLSVNPNGSVTGLVDREVYFPVPSSVHFIGAKSGK